MHVLTIGRRAGGEIGDQERVLIPGAMHSDVGARGD
jgi:hypothetical protein